VPPDASYDAADGCGRDDRRREQHSDQRSDRDPSPGAVLGRLLVLFDVDLAVGVLGDQRDVIGPDELVVVELEQNLVATASSWSA
jgi:hypothetical protein